MNVEQDLENAPKPGYPRKDSFDFRETIIAGNTAYAYWFLEADVNDGEGAHHDRWLESAVFRRSSGAWLVALFHSTPIAKK